MFESFPSKDKGTKTKHVKTLSIRLLLSSLSFQILKDDKYRTCLAWGCSLCNQTTTVSYRLVSESHNKELSSSWYTDQQQVYSFLNQNLSTLRYSGRIQFHWAWEGTHHLTSLATAATGMSTDHAHNMQLIHPRKTRCIRKGLCISAASSMAPTPSPLHTPSELRKQPRGGVCTPWQKGKQRRCRKWPHHTGRLREGQENMPNPPSKPLR